MEPKYSAARCPVLPLPAEPKVSLPGLALAAWMSSWMFFAGSLLLAAGQLAGEAIVAKEPLPEAAAGQLVRNEFDPLAQLARQRRELAEVLRQHGFEFFPQLAA